MKVLYVDRIEESRYAVCEDEDGKECVIDILLLPKNIKEGTVISKNSSDIWVLNEQLTKKRKKEMLGLIQEVEEKL